MIHSSTLMQRLLLVLLLATLVVGCGPARGQAPQSESTPIADSSPPATSTQQPTSNPAPEQSAEAAQSRTPVAETEQPASSLLPNRIEQALQSGTPIAEIADPGLRLPDDIHPKQIVHYFQLGEIAFALVLQGSMNIYLGLPDNGASLPFRGLLVSDDGASWRKYLHIHDRESSDKNNPYYLWTSEGHLYLSLVDQQGAGSGEGILKVARFSAAGEWEVLDGCYYYAAAEGFESTQHLSLHQKLERDCANVRVELVP